MSDRSNTLPVVALPVQVGAWLGWTMALLSTLASSILSPVAKVAVGLGLDPAVVLALRLVVAALLLALTTLIANPAKLRIDRRGLLICLGVGAGTGLGMWMYFRALTEMRSSIAAMIFSLYPLAVLGLLALRGERFTYRQMVRTVIGLSGVYLLIGVGGRAEGPGVFLVFGAILGFAILTVVIQWFLQGYDTMTVTLYTVVGMALPNLAWWIVGDLPWRAPGWLGWLTIVLLALAVTYLGRVTQFIAIRAIGGGQVALLMPLEIFLSVVWSVLLLSERLTPWQWVGGGLILLSALLAARRLGRIRIHPTLTPGS
jgi:drug/metabolite transporter (DMT)-like permease